MFEKGNAITFKNSTISTSHSAYLQVPDVPDDEFCLYKLLHRQITVYFPPDVKDGRLLRREAPAKLLKVRFSKLVRHHPKQKCAIHISLFFFSRRCGKKQSCCIVQILAPMECGGRITPTQN
jgi:hypothetical protein